MKLNTYLARSRLRQIAHKVDLLRRSEGPNDLSNLEDELLDERTVVFFVVLEFSMM